VTVAMKSQLYGMLLVLALCVPGCADGTHPCTEGSVLPKLVYRVIPDYPEMARLAGIEGVVTVVLHVDAQGVVTTATVVDGPVPLHAAAVAAALQFLFEPARLDCVAVEANIAVPVKFTLPAATANGRSFGAPEAIQKRVYTP
jgi:TonB family protein